MKASIVFLFSMFVYLSLAYDKAMNQFLDVVAHKCLDTLLAKKMMKEAKLKDDANAAADEILKTLEFLDNRYLYQVSLALGGSGSDGYFVTMQNYTGKTAPVNDSILYKYYPMGQYSAYAFVYAAQKK